MHLVGHYVDPSYILKMPLGSKENLANCRKKYWKIEEENFEEPQEKMGIFNQNMEVQHEQMSLIMLEKGWFYCEVLWI